MPLPPDALRLVEEAEEAEADGRISHALELYNEGLALAMQSLPRHPDLKPTIEGYLRRALKLQQPQEGSATKAANALAVGDRCRVETKETDGGFARRVGTVAFAGPTVLGDGVWIGVALDQPVAGLHDGFISGVRYFSCPPECGVLVRSSRVQRLTDHVSGHHSSTPNRHPAGSQSRSGRGSELVTSTAKSSTPAHQARLAMVTEENNRRRRVVPQRATSPSAASRRSLSADSSRRRRGHATTTGRSAGSPVTPGLSAQHGGSPPRWGSPMSRSRRDADADSVGSGALANARGEEIRAELEEEVSLLRTELAAAETQLQDQIREREELLETLAVAQDAVAAAAPATAAEEPAVSGTGRDGVASLRREKAMVTRERDRLKSRIGLLTGDRESLQRQLSGLQRKLARRCAAAERVQVQEQELLRLRNENHSLRGRPNSLCARACAYNCLSLRVYRNL